MGGFIIKKAVPCYLNIFISCKPNTLIPGTGDDIIPYDGVGNFSRYVNPRHSLNVMNIIVFDDMSCSFSQGYCTGVYTSVLPDPPHFVIADRQVITSKP